MTSNKPSDPPTSEAGKEALERASNALDNVQTGYGHTPLENLPGTPDPVDRFDTGGTEPTHVPVTDADRRKQ